MRLYRCRVSHLVFRTLKESNLQYLGYLFPKFSKMVSLPLTGKLGVVFNLNNNNMTRSNPSIEVHDLAICASYCLLKNRCNMGAPHSSSFH